MPYIEQAERRRIDPKVAKLEKEIYGVGELNYAITSILLKWLGPRSHYEDYNSVIGILESIKLELYRRAVAPYEDEKLVVNGDVYG
jgi:hypothetical protein